MPGQDPPKPERSCPVVHGPRATEFIKGYGWLFLAVSVLLHVFLVANLALPRYEPADRPPDILISLKEPPPPPPEPEPTPVEPEPEPVVEPEPETPEPPVQPEPEPEPLAPDPEPSPVAIPAEPPPDAEAPPAVPDHETQGTGDGPAAGTAGDPPPEPEPSPEPPAEPEPTVDLKALLGQYAAGVKAQVLSHQSYPQMARRLRHEGSVKVGFTLAADGSVEQAYVKASSGYDELDEAAVSAIHSAAPFAHIPDELDRESISLSITLNYKLSN